MQAPLEEETISITVRGAPLNSNTTTNEPRPPKYDPTVTTGVVPISDAHWEVILKLYLRTYRGPNATEDLKYQLEEYQVLRSVGSVARGRYVRYLPKGLVDVNLKRGGWVVKCNSKSIHLQDGRRQWRVLRRDNFIFVRNEDASDASSARNHRKSLLRLIAEETLYQDDRHREEEEEPDLPPPPPRFKANFT